MDKYKVFSSYSAYDIEAKLNEHAKEEYVLALIEVVSSSIQSQRNVTSIPEYLVVMEHQPMQLPDRIDVPDYRPTPTDVGGAADRHLGSSGGETPTGSGATDPNKGGG